LMIFVKSSFAPFPAQHPYNWANPYIDPWWETLEKPAKEEIYKDWKVVEPYMKALWRWKDRWERQIQADTKTIKTGVVAYASRLDELKKTLLGKEDVPDKLGYPDYWPSEEDWLKEEETRYSSKAQVAWEDFQAAFQHALHLRLSEDRARYQKMLEVMKLIKWKGEAKKAAISNARDEIVARLKKLTEPQEEYSDFDFREFMLKKIEEFRDKKNDLLWKIQEKNEDITDKKNELLWKLKEKNEDITDIKKELWWKIDNKKEEVEELVEKLKDKKEKLLWEIDNNKDDVKEKIADKIEEFKDKKEDLLWQIEKDKENVKEVIGQKLAELKEKIEDKKENIESKLWQEEEEW